MRTSPPPAAVVAAAGLPTISGAIVTRHFLIACMIVASIANTSLSNVHSTTTASSTRQSRIHSFGSSQLGADAEVAGGIRSGYAVPSSKVWQSTHLTSLQSPPQPLSPTTTTASTTTSTTTLAATNFSTMQQQQKESFNQDTQLWSDDDTIGSPSSVVTTSSLSANSSAAIQRTGVIQDVAQTTGTNSSNTPPPVHPLLIYSIRYEIRGYDLFGSSTRTASGSPALAATTNLPSPSPLYDWQHQPSKNSKSLIGGLKNTIGLDFYYSDNESYIFWTDVIEERIYKGTITHNQIVNAEMVVQTGLATAEGLAVDWIGQNIYWVESTLDHIEVANMNGSSRRTLLAGDMESPRAIAVDPRFGFLFWTDWDKKSPRIERATMCGDDRKTLVYIKDVNGGWPNGLTLDYDNLKIYWIDANSDSIHVVDYEGNNHRPLLTQIKSLGHPFSITLFENNLYWTDWKTNSVSMASKYDGSDAKALQRLTSRPFDIKVFHPSRQPKIDNKLNPCYLNNGNCSHLCLLSVNHTRKCECPHLMRLAKDDRTCETDEHVLLIGRTNEIRAVDVNEPLNHIMAPINVPKVFNPRQFEYDSKTRSIFWADTQTNEVKRVQLAGNSIETIIDVIIESPSGLALDWISGNIYVTSVSQQKTPGKIFISNLNGEYISILMDSSQGIISPKSLAVHPMFGLLFCVDENENSEPIIFVASMDGKNKRTIASKLNDPKLDSPSNLAIDYDLHRVYWINQVNNTADNASIQYYDILEKKIVTILDESESQVGKKINPGVLCVDGDYLIMSGRIPTEVLMRVSKYDMNKRTILRTQNLDQVSALRVYNASSQVGTNACSLNNGDCSQLCIPTSSTHKTCKCTMGYSINPLNETECMGKDLFIVYSYNLGMKGISLDPNTSPEDYYLPPIHRAFRASSIDFVHRDNLIYWVDNEEGSITRINRDTTNYQVIVQGLEAEESIAVDWVASNIYWLDPYYDIIEVARLNGSNRYVIVSGDMDKANGIVVNPIRGYIVWSDVGSYPKIETAQLDGSNRRIVVSTNLTRIDDLALDYMEDYIYWVDSNLPLIERIKVDGTGRQIVYNSNSNQATHNHLVSITIYKEHLYIADSVQHQGSIIRCDKNNASDRRIIQQHLGDGIRDIAIFAEQPIPTHEENPCVKDNGGCQDLCLFMGKKGEKRCICSHGKLNEDGLTCRPYDTFVLFSKLSQIDSLHIMDDESFNNSPYPPISIESRGSIISLTVDYSAQRVIYSEITRDQICSVFFNGTDRRVLVEKQSLVEGIAFTNDQLYWTSVHDNSISRFNTTSLGLPKKTCDNSGCKTATVEKIVKLTSDDKPRGIAVDSCTSYVYWTNWNTNASIQRASPHNGYKIESIIKTNIKVPNGIAIDQKLRKLYWCDARLDKIETCDMDGTNRVILISASPQHPFALAIWENYVFWTDWLARGVFRADKYTGQQPMQIKKVSQRPMGIAVAAPQMLECPADPCLNNGGCPAGYHCKQHDGPFGKIILCSNGSRYLSHDTFTLPTRRFTSKNGSSLYYNKTDHDIIMDGLDRFDPTHWLTLEPKPFTIPSIQIPSIPSASFDESTELTSTTSRTTELNDPVVTKSTVEQSTANTTAAIMVHKNGTDPMKILENTPRNVTSSTLNQNADELISEKTTTAQREQTTVSASPVTSSTPFLPPAQKTSEKPSRTTSPPVETTSVKTSTSVDAPSSSPTQAPLNNATLPPCQIVPAALQPTTDATSKNECKLPGQFKCYLSESLVCISGDRRCDGTPDCPSKEDENDCYMSNKRSQYNPKTEANWHKYATVILIVSAAAALAVFLAFGSRGRRRWFVVGTNGAFNHRRMFDDNGTNIEISNPMFDDDDSGNLVHCAFSIDLNERTTNFSNPLYERQVLLMNDKHI